MFVGALELDILLGDVHSLKQKRSVIRPVLAEVDGLDTWQRAVLGFAVVSNDGAYAQQEVDRVIRYVEGLGVGQVIDDQRDVIRFGGEWAT